MMYCRKKSKKRKSGEVPPVFGVDSKDMRHGKEHMAMISIKIIMHYALTGLAFLAGP